PYVISTSASLVLPTRYPTETLLGGAVARQGASRRTLIFWRRASRHLANRWQAPRSSSASARRSTGVSASPPAIRSSRVASRFARNLRRNSSSVASRPITSSTLRCDMAGPCPRNVPTEGTGANPPETQGLSQVGKVAGTRAACLESDRCGKTISNMHAVGPRVGPVANGRPAAPPVRGRESIAGSARRGGRGDVQAVLLHPVVELRA